MSTKTPIRYLGDNFKLASIRFLPFIWHSLWVHQEPPCPPGLQEETSRTHGACWWKFHRSFLRMLQFIWPNFQVHHEPTCPSRLNRKTWGKGGDLIGFLMFFLVKISLQLYEDAPIHLNTSPGYSWLLKETWSKGGFFTGFPMLDLDENFTGAS